MWLGVGYRVPGHAELGISTFGQVPRVANLPEGEMSLE